MDANENLVYEEAFSQQRLERIRTEYDRLGNICYLDQAGTALYAKTTLNMVFADLASSVYSNPHSSSTSSKHCTDSIDQVRYRILQHFNTDVEKYSVIFTGSATESIKLVAESFRWGNDDQGFSDSRGQFVYMEDNHTSVLGMRSVVGRRGACVRCLEHEEALNIFRPRGKFSPQPKGDWPTNSLFVYSGQCNFSGVKYPLSWINNVHCGAFGDQSHWYVLLDASSLVSTAELDLSEVSPDFVCVSFYKMFGYPTGLGALIVKNSSARLLERTYYGGGTVLLALSAADEHVPRPLLHERFEDGTLNFLSIIGLHHAFNAMEEIISEYSTLSRHCFNLAKYLFYSLLRLHHSNGSPAVTLYADTAYDDVKLQGGIVNFNMLRANGEHIGFAEVLHIANVHNIQLRTGCFCNPGACRRHLGLSTEDVWLHFKSGHVCGDENDLIDGRPTGSVRVSFGAHNTKNDVDLLLEMLEKCFIRSPIVRKWPSNWSTRLERLRSKFAKKNEPKVVKGDHRMDKKSNGFDAMRKVNAPEVQTCLSDLKMEPANGKRSSKLHLSRIFLYPIKSCGRMEIEKWELDARGLKYDRQWMITTRSGVALTQKSENHLCLVRPFIDEGNNLLRLSFKGQPDISIPLNPDEKCAYDYSLCQSKVCGDRVRGYDCGDRIGAWLSHALNRPDLRLIRQLPEDTRANKNNAGSLALANQSQFLFINEASVNYLRNALEDECDCQKESIVHRFRGNFVMSGDCEEFVETTWTSVKIGKTHFFVDGPCTRCSMICIDQDTGHKTKEPLTTLTATFQGKLRFGIYLSRRDTMTVPVSINDPIFPSVE